MPEVSSLLNSSYSTTDLTFLSLAGVEIRTGGVQLDPPHINEVVDLYLTADPVTPIPVGGWIEYMFPEGQEAIPSKTSEVCILVSN